MRSVTAALALALCGCLQRDSKEELLGRWTITDGSRPRVAQTQWRSTNALSLNADGTFHAQNLPGRIWGRDGLVIDGKGNWSIAESGRDVNLDLREVKGETIVPNGTQLEMSTFGKGITLLYYIGDPDDLNTIDFEKR